MTTHPAALVLARTAPRDVRALGLPRDSAAVVYLSDLATGSRPTQAAALRHIARFLGFELAACPWSALKVHEAAAVRSWLGETFAPATANRMLSALRGVVRWSAQLDQMPRDRALAICELAPIRGSRRKPGRALAPAELRALLLVPGARPANDLRSAAAVALLYGAGLRRAEACGLHLDALDLVAGRVVVVGKGNKEREVPLPRAAHAQLEAWLDVRGAEPGPLLCRLDRWGHVYPADGVRPSLLWGWCRQLCRSCGVADFSPHDLRRTYCGDLLDSGADLATVQEMMGHANPVTTASYDRRPARVRVAAAARLPYPV